MNEMQSTKTEASADDALKVFAEAASMEQKLRGLKELMKGGKIHSVRENPRFAKSVEDIVREAQSAREPKQKLLALTILARIASRVKAMRTDMNRHMSTALECEPPQLSELGDSEDRAYAALALRCASGDWVIPYLAQSIVEEEAGEKARAELMRTLLRKEIDLSGVFEALSKPLREWKPKTETLGDSVGRRLKRILSAARPELLVTSAQVGDDVGGVIERFVSGAFQEVGPPNSADVSAEVTAEIALFLHDLVRTRFSLAAEASTYRALRVPSRWFLAGRWPEEARDAFEFLSRDIEEAITLLAKQGKSDDELLESLTLVTGSREAALKITSRIADGASGLAKEIVEWLRRGRVTAKAKGAELMAESSQLAADPALALLLIDCLRLVKLLDGPGQDLLNEVRVFEPNLENSAEILLKRTKVLVEGVRALAAKRSLRVRGEAGDVVEHLPTEHEGVRGPVVGARRVRIVRPLVERVRGDDIAEIVIKAVVEPE